MAAQHNIYSSSQGYKKDLNKETVWLHAYFKRGRQHVLVFLPCSSSSDPMRDVVIMMAASTIKKYDRRLMWNAFLRTSCNRSAYSRVQLQQQLITSLTLHLMLASKQPHRCIWCAQDQPRYLHLHALIFPYSIFPATTCTFLQQLYCLQAFMYGRVC